MRFVTRPTAPPSALGTTKYQRRRKSLSQYFALDEAVQWQKRVPTMAFEDDDVLRSLLDLFSGKCAFCEARAETYSVHRFRPQSNADPRLPGKSHIYYAWLADAWENIFPICDECLPDNASYFPVRGGRCRVPTAEEYAVYTEKHDGSWPEFPPLEEPLLLDPCSDSPAGHLVSNADGTIAGIDDRGQLTIAHFNLSRKSLVDRRKRAFERYSAMPSLADDDNQEFVGLWRLQQDDLENDTPARVLIDDTFIEPPRSPPRLQSIYLKNFKAIESLSVRMPPPPNPSEQFAQALLILGENAAGKSSILEAIALALSDVEARVHLVDDPMTLRLNPAQLGNETIARRRSAEVRLDFEAGDRRTLRITGNRFQQVGDGSVPPVFAYGAYRHFLRDQYSWQPSRTVVNLFRSDNLISNPETWLLGLDDDDFNMVVQALREIFDAGDQFDVIERDHERDACFVQTRFDDGLVSRTPLSSVSSGFRTILALACDVMRWIMDRERYPWFTSLTSAHGIVLIDEVEAHLHPRWKIQIMSGLRRALPSMTFIVTTHDPLCLRGMRDGEVMVLNRVPGKSSGSDLPVVVDTLRELPDVSKLTIEQLLTSDLFDLFTTDDAETETKLAQIADYLTEKALSGDNPVPNAAMEELRQQIAFALPVGLGEAGRLVQEAVAEYLVNRRDHSGSERNRLREQTKVKIKTALESL
ncbi:AAA family ATPase [Rhizobium sp. ARZ01]|uniref:AAA family ATPase n=1 Tax=Rhizobium sp. ARZ01 TaxID=2769313 RepID=UPI00178696ED|nr:AAA family ATPase [Rhizobium sp. ARZ01]MBD9372028.1 AAA family ATPase [Rhizobium sp. ARZ01]